MKSSKSKEAKFFCESCGSEVPRNSRVCPTCGKFFAAVRCPKCGRTGTNEEFRNGCPTCGYAINPDTTGYRRGNYGFNNINSKGKTRNGKSGLRGIFGSSKAKSSAYSAADSGLPLWIYFTVVIVLIILVFMLYSCL